MHTLLLLSGLALVLAGSSCTLHHLQRVRDWSQRRIMQFMILTLPLVLLGFSITGLHYFIDQMCRFDLPLWDFLFSAILPLIMGIIVLAAVCLGVIRYCYMLHLMGRGAVPAPQALRQRFQALVARLGIATPHLLLCTYDRPLALTYGIFRPAVLLSTWMIEHLDARELEAVMAHELEHVARHDYLLIWLATMLRDAFFYLPASRSVYRQLHHEKELACDDLAISMTQRPLALASALGKVWLSLVEETGPSRLRATGTAPSLVERGGTTRVRIERLLASRSPMPSQRSQRALAGMNPSLLLFLLLLQSTNLFIICVTMICQPVTLVSRIL